MPANAFPSVFGALSLNVGDTQVQFMLDPPSSLIIQFAFAIEPVDQLSLSLDQP